MRVCHIRSVANLSRNAIKTKACTTTTCLFHCMTDGCRSYNTLEEAHEAAVASYAQDQSRSRKQVAYLSHELRMAKEQAQELAT